MREEFLSRLLGSEDLSERFSRAPDLVTLALVGLDRRARQRAQAEQSIVRRLPQLERSERSDKLQAFAVVAGVENGEVPALVGGRRSGYSGFNRALEAMRPVGSLIKPVVYLEALSRPNRYTPVTRLQDRAIELKGGDGKVTPVRACSSQIRTMNALSGTPSHWQVSPYRDAGTKPKRG